MAKRVTRSSKALSTAPSTSAPKPTPATRAKTLGLLKYKVHNVEGDGNCFYRAVYHVLKENRAAQVQLGIEGTYGTLGDSEELDAVKLIRQRVAQSIKGKVFPEITSTIKTLCKLVDVPDMVDMYPFVTKEVCAAKGAARYAKIAALVEDTSEAMYASSLEMDVIQNIIKVRGLTILAVSAVDGETARSRTTKWKNDLGALLRTAATPNVAVILNDDNIHYQYLAFKGPGDDDFHTVLDRQRFRDVLLADAASSAALLSVAQSPPVTITISSSGPSSPSSPSAAYGTSGPSGSSGPSSATSKRPSSPKLASPKRPKSN
jgi:hypothetical protein